jgi:hypothetical protein
MTTLGQIREQVAQELPNVNYKWQDTDTNIRLVEEIRDIVDGLSPEGSYNIPTAKHIAEVAVACKKYFNLRDFIMGLRLEKPSPNVATYLKLLTETLDDEHAVPFFAVLSTYHYEFGMAEEAHSNLDFVFNINPDYSLAQLLKRVYMANWPTEMMVKMAEDLHEKVVANIYAKETE